MGIRSRSCVLGLLLVQGALFVGKIMYKVPARPPLVLLHLLVLGPAVLEPDGDGVEVEVRATGEILDHARVRVLGVARETLFEYFDLEKGQGKRCHVFLWLVMLRSKCCLCD